MSFKKGQNFNKGRTKKDFPNLSNSGVKKGNIPWNKGKKWNKEVIEKFRIAKLGKKRSLSIESKESFRQKMSGKNNWKCRIADVNCDGQLQAHHILRWADYPELRYEINNGIALCQAHHPRKRAEEKRLAPQFFELVSVSK